MIHPSAIIDPSAKLAENVSIGPWTYIGPDVEIGEGTCVHSHVVIKGPTRIGCDNEIFQFASIGEVTQDKKYEGEDGATLIFRSRNGKLNATIESGQSKSVFEFMNYGGPEKATVFGVYW